MKYLLFIILSFTQIYSSSDLFKNSILEIKITSQAPNYIFPWQTKKPNSIDAIGIVTKGNKILVLTSSLENSTSIEIKRHNGTTVPAKIFRKDNESNLSLLEVEDKNFFANLKPIEFQNTFSISGSVQVYHFGDSGSIQTVKAFSTGIDQEIYPISYTRLPYMKINSNEKLEGFGELLVEKEKVIGIIYKFFANKNSGKAIPGFVINQFLNSNTKENESAFPFEGFKFRQLSDSASKEYYGLTKTQEGVQVTEIFQNSTASGKLQVNDILLEIGNQKVDSQGYFNHPKFGKQLISIICHTENEFGYKLGSFLPLKIIRDKKEMQINLKLKSFNYNSVKIPYANYHGEDPKYLISSGFVFTELSEFLLKEFGSNWRGRVDRKLLYLNDYHKYQTGKEKGKYILLIQVLPDIANNGYHNLSFDLVKTVNGKKINSIYDLDKALNDKSENNFVDIELDNSVNIIIDKTKLPEIDKRIQEKFSREDLKNF